MTEAGYRAAKFSKVKNYEVFRIRSLQICAPSGRTCGETGMTRTEPLASNEKYGRILIWLTSTS